MDLQQFLNRAKILRSIDLFEIKEAGWGISQLQWMAFRDAPIEYLISADDDVAALIWAIVEKRAGGPYKRGDRILIEARVEALGVDDTENAGEVVYSVPGAFHRNGGATSIMAMGVMGRLEGHGNETVTLFTRPRKA